MSGPYNVSDFIVAEPSDTGMGYSVHVYDVDGNATTLVKNQPAPMCERIEGAVRDALRTWEGWR